MSSHFTMTQLLSATNNFATDMIIGIGSLGLVYKAQLSNGLTVAIKKPSPNVFLESRQFRAEAETLGKLRHPNIVKLLGYQASGSGTLLVYEYLEKGDLYSWLHHDSRNSFFLWLTRLKILRGVANGLAYLHGLKNPIIHRDVTAKNVLLDSDFEAHITDFGLARTIDASLSHVSTLSAGTMGYMPPEYKEGFTMATVKVDVYSFGILMLEVATGRRPNVPVIDGKEIGLVEWARKMVSHNRHMEMIDRNISREKLVIKSNVSEYFKIALLCTGEISRDRPTMSNVVQMLNEIPICSRWAVRQLNFHI